MIIAWTGHRPDLFLDPDAAQAAVEQVARELVPAAPATGQEPMSSPDIRSRTRFAAQIRFALGGQDGSDTRLAVGDQYGSFTRCVLGGQYGSATRFVVGGQRGVDTWAAQAAIELGIRFVLVLPLAVEAFTSDWPPADRAALHRALIHADKTDIAGGYTPRNQLLAESADLLVAVWTRTAGGGTAETVALARAAGTPIREIILPPSTHAEIATGRGI